MLGLPLNNMCARPAAVVIVNKLWQRLPVCSGPPRHLPSLRDLDIHIYLFSGYVVDLSHLAGAARYFARFFLNHLIWSSAVGLVSFMCR